MAFNKVSVVVFVLLVIATIAYARPDVFDDSSAGLGQTIGRFCSLCECLQVTGGGFICLRTDIKVRSCPFNCDPIGSTPWPCSCDENTSACQCTYEVETCNPTACPWAKMTLPEMAAAAQEN